MSTDGNLLDDDFQDELESGSENLGESDGEEYDFTGDFSDENFPTDMYRGAGVVIDGEVVHNPLAWLADADQEDATGGDPWQPGRDGADALNATVENGLPDPDDLLPDWVPWAIGGTLGTVVLLVVIFVLGQLVNLNFGGGS